MKLRVIIHTYGKTLFRLTLKIHIDNILRRWLKKLVNQPFTGTTVRPLLLDGRKIAQNNLNHSHIIQKMLIDYIHTK